MNGEEEEEFRRESVSRGGEGGKRERRRRRRRRRGREQLAAEKERQFISLNSSLNPTHGEHAPERRRPEADHRHLEARVAERTARKEARRGHFGGRTRGWFREREREFSIVR